MASNLAANDHLPGIHAIGRILFPLERGYFPVNSCNVEAEDKRNGKIHPSILNTDLPRIQISPSPRYSRYTSDGSITEQNTECLSRSGSARVFLFSGVAYTAVQCV
jgi:hypothetical protein